MDTEFKHKISVIVPVYNCSAYLKQCVDSIIQQTYTNIEVILVDDGSTDDSGVICDQFASSDERVKVIHKINGGLSSSREAGISLMSGEYGMMVDADDWIDTRAIEKCVEILEAYSVECVLFSYVREYPAGSFPVHIYPQSQMFRGADSRNVHRRFFGLCEAELGHPETADSVGSCWGKLYSVEMLKRGRFFDTKIVGSAEDALFNVYAFTECRAMFYLDEPLYHYRKYNENSITSQYKKKLQSQWRVLFREFEKAKEELCLGQEYREALNNRIALSIVGIGLNELYDTESTALQKVRRIHKYISSALYKDAVKQIELTYLPLVWKIFLLCARAGLSIPVYMMLCAMKAIKSKK